MSQWAQSHLWYMWENKLRQKNKGGKNFHKIEIKSKEIGAGASRLRISSLDISQPFASIVLRFRPPVFKQKFYILLYKQSLRTCKVVLECKPKSSSVGVCFSSPRCCLATGRWEQIASSYIQDNSSFLTASAAAFGSSKKTLL